MAFQTIKCFFFLKITFSLINPTYTETIPVTLSKTAEFVTYMCKYTFTHKHIQSTTTHEQAVV